MIIYYVTFCHFQDAYDVVIFGNSSEVMVGSSVELTCAVLTKGHEPVAINLFWENGGIKTKTLNDILLPNGNWYKGISTSFKNVTSDDGTYTCEACWKNPNYNKSAVFNLRVLGK